VIILSKSGTIFLGCWLLMIVGLISDNLFFRPRETPILQDRIFLSAELDKLAALTSLDGSWGERNWTSRNGLAVSADFIRTTIGKSESEIIADALVKLAWVPAREPVQDAYISYCKAQYRANLYWLRSPSRYHLSLSVKRYKSDYWC
jgi:hypothetical protein